MIKLYRLKKTRPKDLGESFISAIPIPFEFRQTKDEVFLDISVDLNPILQPENFLEIGVTTIIQTNFGNESYWAFAHPGQHADFHLRESLCLKSEQLVSIDGP